MTLRELEILCKQGENQFLEFKQYASEPLQVTEEVSGFLNSTGGDLLIGVKDNGGIIGLKYADDDLAFLLDHITNNIVPKPTFNYELIPVTRKRSVIHFSILEGKRKPYKVKGVKDEPAKIFFRVDDCCLKASRELRSILRKASSSKGQTIIYSTIESSILRLIDQEHRLSKDQLVRKLDFKARNISDSLVRLVTSGVLKIRPTLEGDLYEFNQNS